MSEGDTSGNSNSAGSTQTGPVGIGSKETKSNLSVPSGSASSTKGSGQQAGAKRKPASSRNATKRPGNTPSSPKNRGDWRQSAWTTFILGLLIIAGISYLVTKNWQVPAAFGIGILFTAVMLMGGDDHDN